MSGRYVAAPDAARSDPGKGRPIGLGLGLDIDGGDGGGVVPHLRYDARAGRLFRVDRGRGIDRRWATELVDISEPPPAFAMDLERMEVGWLAYGAVGPDLRMVASGRPLPPRPGPEHRRGFRVMVHAPELFGGVREFASCAEVVVAAVDALRTAFEAAPERADGLVPIVRLVGTTAVAARAPQGGGTNHAPVFRIEGWVARPAGTGPAAAGVPPVPPCPARQAAPAPRRPAPAAAAAAHAVEF